MKCLTRLVNLLLVPRCVHCDESLPYGAHVPLCDACRVQWESEKKTPCPVCQKPQAHCRCVPHRALTALDLACALAPYHPEDGKIARAMILGAKTHLDADLTEFLADELARIVPAHCLAADAKPILTYIPRKRSRVRRYGYDQARELARALGALLDLPKTRTLLFVGAETGTQKERSFSERFAAAKESYQPTREIEAVRDRTVLLLDDVLTTGASAAACTAILKAHGARTVCLLTLAKTPKREG